MGEKDERVDARRSLFWQSALASDSILLWIVTNMADPERPFP
ncbi:MAG: hypothetical protein Q4F81_09285 [Eubacteriales bacterium]|nr:hypothetical protein [Eubacteriales bacterium]